MIVMMMMMMMMLMMVMMMMMMVVVVVVMMMMMIASPASPWLETSMWWLAGTETTALKLIVIYVTEIQN